MSPQEDPGTRSASHYRDQAKHARERAAAATPNFDWRAAWLEIADAYDKVATIAERAPALQCGADAGSPDRVAQSGERRAPPRGAALGSYSVLGEGCEDLLLDDQCDGRERRDQAGLRGTFKRRRCLVPADGFYEWQKRDGNTKQPYRIVMADGSPMAFAGLWKRWTDPASGEAVRSFTILTIGANALCAPIHNRMPAIVDAVDWPTWLGEAPATSSGLKAVLRPPSAALMEAHMIRPRIGNVRNDDAAPINRVNSD
jgi:hypothetical protein